MYTSSVETSADFSSPIRAIIQAIYFVNFETSSSTNLIKDRGISKRWILICPIVNLRNIMISKKFHKMKITREITFLFKIT